MRETIAYHFDHRQVVRTEWIAIIYAIAMGVQAPAAAPVLSAEFVKSLRSSTDKPPVPGSRVRAAVRYGRWSSPAIQTAPNWG
jgi:hypothetical protein